MFSFPELEPPLVISLKLFPSFDFILFCFCTVTVFVVVVVVVTVSLPCPSCLVEVDLFIIIAYKCNF